MLFFSAFASSRSTSRSPWFPSIDSSICSTPSPTDHFGTVLKSWSWNLNELDEKGTKRWPSSNKKCFQKRHAHHPTCESRAFWQSSLFITSNTPDPKVIQIRRPPADLQKTLSNGTWTSQLRSCDGDGPQKCQAEAVKTHPRLSVLTGRPWLLLFSACKGNNLPGRNGEKHYLHLM